MNAETGRRRQRRVRESKKSRKARIFLGKVMANSLILATLDELDASQSERIVVAGALPEIMKLLRKTPDLVKKRAGEVIDSTMWLATGLTPVFADSQAKQK